MRPRSPRLLPLLFLTPLVLAAAPPAGAGPPDSSTSSVPAFIDVVGTAGGVVDPSGTFTITVRDDASEPLPGILVTLDFRNCTDLRLSRGQGPGVTLSCSLATLTATTDAVGRATFTVVGASVDPCDLGEAYPGAGLGCLQVTADGVALGRASVAIYDLNGALSGDGVNAVDLLGLKRGVLQAGGGAPYRARYDYDHNGEVNALDIASYNVRVVAPAARGLGSSAGSGGAGYCGAPAAASLRTRPRGR